MSKSLEAKVWESGLDSTLKPIAACLADIGNHDGSRIFPTVAYIGWLVGKDVRTIQRNLKQLRDMGILTVVKEAGGRRRGTEYQFNTEALPKRAPWIRGPRRDDIVPPVDENDTDDVTDVVEERGGKTPPVQVTSSPERVTKTAEGMTPEPPYPLEPNTEPNTVTNNIDADVKPKKKSADKGTRIPEPFLLTAEMRAWAKEEVPQVDIVAGTREFVDFWRGKPGVHGRKCDWIGTWRNRMRALQERALDKAHRNGNGRYQPQSKADLSVQAGLELIAEKEAEIERERRARTN